ncbi:AMP-binding protein [Actinosynnema sp. NPDC020468]|uniref:AMP-binding protein n=1 Tax=Actinosynnema sp. NPDC020468 TaxID=3154488 RepID=UPI0033CE4D44
MHERFDAAASRYPDQTIAFPGEDERLTYRELAETSRRMAGALHDAGARDVVGVLCPNNTAFLQGVLAASRLGAAACPLPLPMGLRDLEGYVRRTRKIIATAGLTHLVTVPRMKPITEHLDVTAHEAETLVLGEDREFPAVPIDATAVLQFTSGSTSDPKGVVLTHRNVLSCAESITKAIAIKPEDGWGSWLPLFHDMGLFGTLTGLFNGIPLTLWSPADFVKSPGAWLRQFAAVKATICAMPNFGYDYLTTTVSTETLAELDLAHWRVAFNGAESIGVRSLEAFLEHYSLAGFRPEAMTPAYGMAEATLVVTLPPLDRPPVVEWCDRVALTEKGVALPVPADHPDARGLVGLGLAVPGMACRIGDGLPDGTVGEVQVRGGAVTGGYLGGGSDPFTADGWLRTGDLGYLREGELYFTGRSKEMITLRGVNVYPLDVEAVAREVAGVHQQRCVAFALLDDGVEKIVLCAETRLSDEDERAALRKAIAVRCAVDLGLPEVDVRLVKPRTIPRTTSGKLQRLGMRDLMKAEATR